ncbi:MAG: WYL domain-containing transcriptional regulator [Phycisphaerae bacterium]|nr:WYL domain-containing transcriptional regulator [Phycisphaerae bacterium]
MGSARPERLLRLLRLLRGGNASTVDQLANGLGVSRRTVFRDLNLLQLAGVNPQYDPDRGSYRVDQSSALSSLDLTLDEALAILLVARKFVSEQSFPSFEAASRAARKIGQCLPPETALYCERMIDGLECRLPPLADASRIEATFHVLHRAWGHRRKVRIEYDSYFERATIRTVLSPYRILFAGRAWYVIGHSASHDAVRTFKLDRITATRVLDEAFEPDPTFDVDAYFGSAWSVIPEGKLYHVRLRFLPKVAGNVEEITWHESQRFTAQPDGSCVFEADVDGLTEISWWILGYGDQVIVEEPPELRERIGRIARGMCRLAGVRAPGAGKTEAS